MTEQDALLAAIRENPDDDTPRLVYADWLDEHATTDADRARAELIRDQIALARLPEYSPDAVTFLLRKELTTRSNVTLFSCKKEWTAELPARAVEFRRGFPDRVEGTAADILADDGLLLDRAPVRSLWLQTIAPDEFAELLRRPWLARIRHLRMHADSGLDYEPLADCPHFANLKSLWLGGGTLSRGGLVRLGRSPYLAALRNLTLDDVSVGETGFSLADPTAFPHLERLNLLGTMVSSDGLEAVAGNRTLPRLTCLWISFQRPDAAGGGQFDVAAARALARSAFWPNLRDFGIWSSDLTAEPLVELATAPNPPAPVALDLCGNLLTETGVVALAASPLLRDVVRLRLDSNRIGTEGLAALAGSPFVGSLGEALIDGNPFGPQGAEALAQSENFARLFALSVSRCEFGEEGFRHLAASPLLDQLVSLYVGPRDSSQAVKDMLHLRMGDRVKF